MIERTTIWYSEMGRGDVRQSRNRWSSRCFFVEKIRSRSAGMDAQVQVQGAALGCLGTGTSRSGVGLHSRCSQTFGRWFSCEWRTCARPQHGVAQKRGNVVIGAVLNFGGRIPVPCSALDRHWVSLAVGGCSGWQPDHTDTLRWFRQISWISIGKDGVLRHILQLHQAPNQA